MTFFTIDFFAYTKNMFQEKRYGSTEEETFEAYNLSPRIVMTFSNNARSVSWTNEPGVEWSIQLII